MDIKQQIIDYKHCELKVLTGAYNAYQYCELRVFPCKESTLIIL